MKPEVETSIGISVTNTCYQCQLLQDLCVECDETREARDTQIAHEIVDERNLIYPFIWRNSPNENSGHDGNSSATIIGKAKPIASLIETRHTNDTEPGFDLKVQWIQPDSDYEFRNEFLEPTTSLVDRLFNLEESITLAKYESVCQDCHLVINSNAICPNCN